MTEQLPLFITTNTWKILYEHGGKESYAVCNFSTPAGGLCNG